MIKNFKQWLLESYLESTSREDDWNKFKYRNNKLLYSNNLYDVYKVDNYSYFISDKDDDYLGHLTLNDDWNEKDSVQIWKTDSNSQYIKGFYKLMLPLVFKDQNITTIYSDGNLSDNAVRSYTRLSQDPQFNIKILDKLENKIIDFDNKLVGQSNKNKYNLIMIQLN